MHTLVTLQLTGMLIGQSPTQSSGHFPLRGRNGSREAQPCPPACPPTAAPAWGRLRFDASFESANLLRAVQISQAEYNLILCPDTNTIGHTQWYYFAVHGAMPGVQYKLNFINMQKPDSLYNEGLRPLMYSTTRAKREVNVLDGSRTPTGEAETRARDSSCGYKTGKARTAPGRR